MSSMNISEIQICNNFTETHTPVKTPIGSLHLMQFALYALPIACLVGVIGNFLSFIILKSSAFRLASHFYLTCLTICDICSLLSMIPTFWAVMILQAYYEKTNHVHVSWVETYLVVYGICQARMFITFFFRTLSIWLIVLFTGERLIAVVWPLHAQRLCSVRNAIISVMVLVVISASVNLPWFFSFKPIRKPCTGRVSCAPNQFFFVNRLIEFAFLTIVPATFICIANSLIAATLRKQTKLFMLHDKRAVNRLQRTITRRLLAVSCTFVLLTLPCIVSTTIYTVYDLRNDSSAQTGPLADLYHISMLLFAVNLAINFVLYLLTGKNFRRAVGSLLCCQLEKMRRYRSALARNSKDGDDPQTAKTIISSSSQGHRPSQDNINTPLYRAEKPSQNYPLTHPSYYKSGQSPLLPSEWNDSIGDGQELNDKESDIDKSIVNRPRTNEESSGILSYNSSSRLSGIHSSTEGNLSPLTNSIVLPAVKPRLQKKPQTYSQPYA